MGLRMRPHAGSGSHRLSPEERKEHVNDIEEE